MSEALILKKSLEKYPVSIYTPSCNFGAVVETERSKQAALQIPETGNGFEPYWWYAGSKLDTVKPSQNGWYAVAGADVREQDMANRYIPLWIRTNVPGEGTYSVTATIYARAAGQVLLFTSRRRLAWRGILDAGERITVQTMTDVSAIIPRGHTAPVAAMTVDIALLGDAALCAIAIEKKAVKRIFVLGDSTVTDQVGNVPYSPSDSFGGWGQMLSRFLPDGLCVSNHAHSGLTTESFRTAGHWALVEPRIAAGDICLLQFGHNDQKLPHLTAEGGYSVRLSEFIEKIRAKGAQPILVTPLARNSWTPDGRYNDLLADYADAVHAVGIAHGVDVIDLHAASIQHIKSLGCENAKAWFYPSDYTHTNDYGAYAAAHFVAEQLCKILSLPFTHFENWQSLPINALVPPTDLVCTNPKADPCAPFADERPNDVLSRVEALELVIAVMKLFPINVYNDLFQDVLGDEPYAGTVQCAAQNGLIPAAFITENKILPQKPITIEEFFGVLMTGYGMRCRLQEVEETPDGIGSPYALAARQAIGERLASENTVWNEQLTRKEAASICRKVKI